MKKKKLYLREETAEKFDLPGEIVAGMPKVTVTGCRRVYIENHRGILEYGKERININGGRVIIKISGDNLCIKGMSGKELIVMGDIIGIEFER